MQGRSRKVRNVAEDSRSRYREGVDRTDPTLPSARSRSRASKTIDTTNATLNKTIPAAATAR